MICFGLNRYEVLVVIC